MRNQATLSHLLIVSAIGIVFISLTVFSFVDQQSTFNTLSRMFDSVSNAVF